MSGSNPQLGHGNFFTYPFGDWFKGSDAEIDPYGQLNPEQRQVTQQIGPLLQAQLSKGPSYYTGRLVEPITGGEQTAIDQSSRLAAMTGDWSTRFQPGEINPEVNATELANLNRQFYGSELSPGAKALAEEQYAGTGGYWGGARANAVMGTYKDTVTNPYQNWRSTALQNSYQNALNYAQGQNIINQTNATIQSIPRVIKQYGLDKTYTDYTNANAAYAQQINQALNFLGISTATYTPAQPSEFAKLLPELLKVGASAAGAAAGKPA